MNVLISIKPNYVSEILNGNKKYEYRKSIFKRNVNKVYIYSTNPKKRIIGYFEYSGYLSGTPDEIWNITKEFSGIDKNSYFEYFNNKELAYAIRIKNLNIFDVPLDPKNNIENFKSPQSYMYLDGDLD